MFKFEKYKYLIMPAIVFAVCLLLDIISKKLVHANIPEGRVFNVIPYLIDFGHGHNTGAAFSMGAGNKTALILFTAVSCISSIAIVLVLIFWKQRHWLFSLSLGLILAGAVGNLIDRIVAGKVCDFIQFAFWKNFATFNLADTFVFCGAVLFSVYFLFIYKEPKKTEKKTVENEC